jgi:hypothetical protein
VSIFRKADLKGVHAELVILDELAAMGRNFKSAIPELRSR